MQKRSLSIAGHRTSIALEAEFWAGLEAMAAERHLTMASLVREIDAGYVWVNGRGQRPTGLPFGGVKISGLGRESNLGELLSYTQEKSVIIDASVS